MEATLGLLGNSGGGGSGSTTTTGSMSTVSEDNMILSSEVSSSYPDESELELGLGLSCGGGLKSKPTPWGQYARILTAKDFPSLVSKSSSSASSVTKANNTNSSSAGTKRTAADSVSPPKSNGTTSQVVGWPPIRAYRMNSLVNQAKSSATEEFSSAAEENKSKNVVVDKTNYGSNTNNNVANERRPLKTSLFVKVNMDGTPIGRKVDLNAHSCYETLAETLDDMFCKKRSSLEGHDVMTEATGPSKLLDGSSEFVLTYEDKEGDWMLVGDVPWRMFLSCVKRLRIMRTPEAHGLDTRFQERSGRQRTKAN